MSLLSRSVIKKFFSVPLWFFVFNNFIPVYGLIFYSWEINDIFLFFIIELFIIGIITVLKIILLKKTSLSSHVSSYKIPTKLNFYIKMRSILVFLIIYGIYVIAFSWIIINTFDIKINKYILLTILAVLLLRTGFLFFDYLRNKAYFKRSSINTATEFLIPMTFIIIATIFISNLGSSFLGLGLFLFVKTCSDYWVYKPESLRR